MGHFGGQKGGIKAFLGVNWGGNGAFLGLIGVENGHFGVKKGEMGHFGVN